MMLKKTTIIGVVITRVQKIESINFKVRPMKDGNKVNLSFDFNCIRIERSRDASIAHVLKLGTFILI